MSLTHRDLAAYVAALYDAPAATPWLYLSNPDANVYIGIMRANGYLVVTLRGSFNLGDWLADLRARPIARPAGRPELADVHAGFYDGTQEAWDIIASRIAPDDKLVFCGHSLGAARAVLLAGTARAHGLKPHFIACWGEPPPLMPAGNAWVTGIPGVSYRNALGAGLLDIDQVTAATQLAGYRPRIPVTDLRAPPPQRRPLDPFDLHHFALYLGATPATEI
jgi:Lipase (class 3)